MTQRPTGTRRALRAGVFGAMVAALLSPSAAAVAATLTGTVSWSKPRVAQPVHIARDRHVCAVEGVILDREVLLDAAHRVEGAVVWLDGLGLRPTPAVDAEVDQRGCRFVPRVAVATVGGRLRFTSADPILHNVHVVDVEGRDVANWAMPVMGQEVRVPLERAGELRVRCDAGHGWMRAGVQVFDHPFFTTTGPGGRYTLTGVPAGEHRLVAWHPDLGRVEVPVVVGEGAREAPPLRVDAAFPNR